MSFQGAVVREQGVTFGVLVVKQSAISNAGRRDQLVAEASAAFGGIPTVLMAQAGKQVRYYGRPDLVRFLKGVPVSAIPWRRYYLN